MTNVSKPSKFLSNHLASTALPASSALFVQIVNTLACPPLNHSGHLGPEGQLLLGA